MLNPSRNQLPVSTRKREETLRSLGLTSEPRVDGYFVKAPVFPFNRFPREDTLLGPEL